MPAVPISTSGPGKAGGAGFTKGQPGNIQHVPRQPAQHTRPHAPKPAGPLRPGQAPPSGAASTDTGVQPVTADPRDALYFDTLAKLNFQYNNSLAGFQQSTIANQAGYTAAKSQLQAQLPPALQTDRSKANALGVLQSGVEAQRQGGVTAANVDRQLAALKSYQGTQQRLDEAQQTAEQTLPLDQKSALDAAVARSGRADIANSPNTVDTSGGTMATQGAAAGLTKGRAFTPATQQRLSKGTPGTSVTTQPRIGAIRPPAKPKSPIRQMAVKKNGLIYG